MTKSEARNSITTIRKLTIEQAKSLTKDIITCLSKHNKEQRTILANAQLTDVYIFHNHKSFDEYLDKCTAKAKIGMKKNYARKQLRILINLNTDSGRT